MNCPKCHGKMEYHAICVMESEPHFYCLTANCGTRFPVARQFAVRDFLTEKAGGAHTLTVARDILLEERREVDDALSTVIFMHRMGIGRDGQLLRALAKELADEMYALYNEAESAGIDLDAAFAAVHESNMTKDPMPGQGKVQKGPNYVAPDLSRVLR